MSGRFPLPAEGRAAGGEVRRRRITNRASGPSNSSAPVDEPDISSGGMMAQPPSLKRRPPAAAVALAADADADAVDLAGAAVADKDIGETVGVVRDEIGSAGGEGDELAAGADRGIVNNLVRGLGSGVQG